MLKIRLQRVGRKHEPSFRLVLTDSENSSKSGRFKEVLGSYDPRKTTDALKSDRIKHWLEKGVQATGTVHNLLVSHKIIDAKKVNVLPKKVVDIKAEEATPAPIESAKIEESAPVEPQAEAAPAETAEAVQEQTNE
jgi:small subunit ribosomal protein S16